MPEKAEKPKAETPKADAFKIKGAMNGSLKDISNALRTVSFLEVAQEKDVVNAAYVESRDIRKEPYLFSVLKIKKDEVELLYSIPPDISPKKRRLDMIRYLLNILSLIEPNFKVDQKTLYQLVEMGVKEISEGITMEHVKLFTSYDTVKKELEDAKKTIERLRAENETLKNKNYQLKEKNDELLLRVKELEGLSDETIRSRLLEWIAEHDGEINIFEFCKVYKVNETRVEEMLNKMLTEGYIEVLK